MNSVYCGYYDEEMDQSIPAKPTLEEAVTLFKRFRWGNTKVESSEKLLIFQSGEIDEASLSISKFDEGAWCVSAATSKRRRFWGPFFKVNTFGVFLDKNSEEVECILRLFYECSTSEFSEFLKSNTE
ncbi:hypothetical protein [Microbulbifer elongatus]|uniref:hypothetical protein n=1 Tax=Microbulbifer elongatus TaxID=86173 RepID=UPI001E5BB98B|nr:hypothetical protein [Microbulbifer elongatus]